MRLITLNFVDSPLDMFNAIVGARTEAADEIVQSFDVSGMNAVAVFNDYGISMRLTVTDNSTASVSFDETVSLVTDKVTDLFDYFFAPVRLGRDVIFYFAPHDDATAVITIENTGATAKCGLCVPGVATQIGRTLAGPRIGAADYSIVDTNTQGQTYFDVGDWAKLIDADIRFPLSIVKLAQKQIAQNIGVVAVFDFNDYDQTLNTSHTSVSGLETLLVCGYTENFGGTVSNGVTSTANLSVRGVT